MLPFHALLFDLDGVLVDSTAVVERTWRAFAARHALDAARVVRAAHGRRAIDTIADLTPAVDGVAELARMIDEEATDLAGLEALPGAAALLTALPLDRWAVVTSGVRAVAEARLRAAGLPIPAVLVPADEIARGKPDPEGYLHAAARLGAAPADCVVLEDAPAGLAAARAAGMRVVALTTTHDAASVAGADLVVPTLAALRVHAGRADSAPLVLATD